MAAILGKVTAVDERRKMFTVTAVVKRRGREGTTEFEIPWSPNTAFVLKGQRKLLSKPERIRPGSDVIVVQLGGPGFAADLVWHPPVGGVVALTATECKNLGGKLEDDWDCPSVGPGPGQKRRCRTAGGSMCITESEKG